MLLFTKQTHSIGQHKICLCSVIQNMVGIESCVVCLPSKLTISIYNCQI